MLAGNDKNAQMEAMKAANKGWDKPPTPITPSPAPSYSGSMMGQFGGMGANGAPGPGSVPVATSGVIVGFNGKLAPPPAPQPEI